MAVEVVLEMLFTFPVKPGQPFSELEANMLSMLGRGVLVTGSEGLPQSWVQVSWALSCLQADSPLADSLCVSQNV